MPIKHFRPLTPSQRFTSLNKVKVSKERPIKALTDVKVRSGGRNVYGRVTSRRIGGGHKQIYRIIDFKRDILDIPARVAAIEYDPNRTAPEGLKVGDVIRSAMTTDLNGFTVGNSYPLSIIPPSTQLHCVEMIPGKGAQLARSAGVSLELIGIEDGNATLKMPSGELRLVNARCRATIGVVGNGDQVNRSLGKAGRKRWMGRRPISRGVARNPVDHPNGGGQGKSKGGGGRQQIVSPWGQLAKGFPTRRRTRLSSSFILIRKNGRPPRNKK